MCVICSIVLVIGIPRRCPLKPEMIIPQEGVDDLGQQVKATTTFLRYRVVLAYRMDTQFTFIRNP